MRLEMGTFPVERITFGSETRYADGRLQIDKEAVIEAVHADPRIASVDLEVAYPGESARIWPVRDVIEPRIKVEGPGVTYPGTAGRSITTVGEGRTHRLSGMGITEVSSVNWHDAGGDFVEVYLDMSGPWSETHPAEPTHPPVRGRRTRPRPRQRGPERRRAQGGSGGQRSGRGGDAPSHPAAAGSVRTARSRP